MQWIEDIKYCNLATRVLDENTADFDVITHTLQAKRQDLQVSRLDNSNTYSFPKPPPTLTLTTNLTLIIGLIDPRTVCNVLRKHSFD